MHWETVVVTRKLQSSDHDAEICKESTQFDRSRLRAADGRIASVSHNQWLSQYFGPRKLGQVTYQAPSHVTRFIGCEEPDKKLSVYGGRLCGVVCVYASSLHATHQGSRG